MKKRDLLELLENVDDDSEIRLLLLTIENYGASSYLTEFEITGKNDDNFSDEIVRLDVEESRGFENDRWRKYFSTDFKKL